MSENTEVEISNIQQSLRVLQLMVETINSRTIDILKEQNKVKYMLDLKKSKALTSTIKEMTEEDKVQYVVKQKMYLQKLNAGLINQPKEQTLEYYKISKEGETYKISET
jgi:hypothetical protein